MTESTLSDTNFFGLQSQGNIYCTTALTGSTGVTKVLIATLSGKVYCLHHDGIQFQLEEIYISFISEENKVISIDAIDMSYTGEGLSLGITLTKKEDLDSYAFAICPLKNVDKELEIPSHYTTDIDYLPYCLYHTVVPRFSQKKTFWLMSGGDNKIHTFSCSKKCNYQEINTKEYFPEFQVIEDVVLHISIFYTHNYKLRHTTACGENGSFYIFQTALDSEVPIIKSSQVFENDFPVTCSEVCSFKTGMKNLPYLQFDKSNEKLEIIAVCATSFEPAYVYREKDGFYIEEKLPCCNLLEVITCCIVCDIDFDGQNEILLGSYGQSVIIYKYYCGIKEWKVIQILKVSYPVLSLCYCSVKADGANQLIVITTFGIHIFQHSAIEIFTLVQKMLSNLEINCLEDQKDLFQLKYAR